MPALQVLDEVGAAVVGVSPGHRGTYGTHLPAKQHSVRDGFRFLAPEQTSALCGLCPVTFLPG